ncbi:MAG: TetR/AcrR family transcriptional regulator [Synergistaceae bacterium]|jgi:AcrR family transcriptional regulator|nr:TetR/AcrR family transcriptional regulator [Synergistaceae bacterium]
MSRKNDSEQTVSKILDTAAELFMEKGYEQTTMQNIVDGLGMSKGAIFHHFRSKEDVMDGVIRRVADGIVEHANAIADDPALSVNEKMRDAILSMNVSEGIGGTVIDELHKPSNAQMHQTIMIQTIQTVVPILTKIVEQGINEGIYKTPYPRETLEFLFAANQVIFDSGIFHWNREELASRARCFARIMEISLGAAEGSVAFLFDNMNLLEKEN